MKAILTCFSAALFFFYCILSLSIFNNIGTNVMQYYSLTNTQLGILSSGYLYANAIFLIPAGFVFDKYSTRNVMLFAMFLAVLGIYGVVCCHLVYIAFAARCLSGIASAFVILGVIRSGIMWFPSKASFVIGSMIAFGMMGGYFASYLYSTITSNNDWLILLKVLDYIGIGILVFMAIFFRNNKQTELHLSTNDYHLLKHVLFDKQNWLAGLYVGFMNLPVFVLGSLFGTAYLVNKYDISSAVASSISADIFIGVMVGSTLFGFWADHCKSRRTPLYAGALLSLLTIGLILMFSLNTTVLHILFFILGVSISSQVIIYTIVADTNQAEVISTAQGVASTLNNLLGALMQILFGYIITLFVANKSYGFKIAMLIFPISFISAIIISRSIKDQKLKKYNI